MRLLKIVPDNTNIDFVRLRYWAFGLTTLLTIAAIALVVVNKLNMGVDFVGGRELVSWLRTLEGETVTSDAAKDLVRRLEAFRAEAWSSTAKP